MFILRTKDGVEFKATVADWMEDLDFAEVFNFSLEPFGQDEIKITQVLDRLVGEVLFGPCSIDKSVARLRKWQAKLIGSGRPQKGEESLGAAAGKVYDDIFQGFVQKEIAHGALSQFRTTLGVAGASGLFLMCTVPARFKLDGT
jgi:hypothetical protein